MKRIIAVTGFEEVKNNLKMAKVEVLNWKALDAYQAAFEMAQQQENVNLKNEIIQASYERALNSINRIIAKFKTDLDLDERTRHGEYADFKSYLKFLESVSPEFSDEQLKKNIVEIKIKEQEWIKAGQTPEALLQRARENFSKGKTHSDLKESLHAFEYANTIATKLANQELLTEIAQECHARACLELQKVINSKNTYTLRQVDKLLDLASKNGYKVNSANYKKLLLDAAQLSLQDGLKNPTGPASEIVDSFARASKYAKEADSKEFQRQIAKTCCERGQSYLPFFGDYYRYSRAGALFHIASELAKHIGDKALQQEISNICFSIAMEPAITSSFSISKSPYDSLDFFTMSAINNPEQMETCLDKILAIKVSDFLMDKRVLWLISAISLLVDPAGLKTQYSPAMLEKRQEIKTALQFAIQDKAEQAEILPKELIGLISAYALDFDLEELMERAPQRLAVNANY